MNKIKIFYNNEKYKLTKKYESDSAYDICARTTNKITIPPSEWKLIPTGIRIKFPSFWEANIRPRSGIALRNGITVLNSPGTIDPGYEGEISIILINLGKTPYIIEDGDRIAQITFQKIPRLDISQYLYKQFENNLNTIQNRGYKGFGPSGIKNNKSMIDTLNEKLINEISRTN